MAGRVRWGWILLTLLLIAGSLVWRAGNLDAFSLSNDEGTHLMWAWLVHSGHPLYSETVSVQGPLFITLVEWAFDLIGVGVVSGRALVLAFLAATQLSLVWCGRLLYGQDPAPAGWLTGIVAAVAFSVAPIAFSLSRLTMGEIPSLSLAVLAVMLTMVYARRGGWLWLLLSGLAFGLSLLVKALNPLLLLPVGWYILSSYRRVARCGWAVRVAGWAIAALLPMAACLLLYDPAAFYDQVIAFRFDLRATYAPQLDKNLVWLVYFTRQQWGIVTLAAAGTVLLARRRVWHALVPLGLWLVGGLTTVLTHSPLFPHHTIILLPPLALLAGAAAAETWQLLVQRRWAWSGMGLVGAVAFLAAIPAMAQANQETLSAGFGREADAIAFLQRVTRPEDNVISDNLLLAFMAARQTPPPLGDLAQVAIDSGRQTSARLIAISEAYPVEAVADWALRLPYLADYMQWVDEHYLVRHVWDNHHIIYFGRKVASDAVPNPRRIRFEHGIEMVGFQARLANHDGRTSEVSKTSDVLWRDQPDALQVTVFWDVSGSVAQDYTVFVHLYDGRGELVASHDGPPLYGYLPTSQWAAGEIVPDRHTIPLPPQLEAGEYRLAVGMYDAATGERIGVTDIQGSVIGDHVDLVDITVPKR
jgi:hypothetical protein